MDILVESLAGIPIAKKIDAESSIRWHSQSPMVIEKLRAVGSHVRWLDDQLPAGMADRIGFAAFETVRLLAPQLECAALQAGISGVMHFAAMPLQRLIAVLAYKELVLDSWLRNTEGPHRVVGDPSLSPPRNGNMSVDRFDTLYAVLAALRGMAVLNVPVMVDRAFLLQEIDKITLRDRLLSVLDNRPAQLMHRLLNYLGRGRVLGERSSSLVRVLRENELIREMLPGILFRGGGICYERHLVPAGGIDKSAISGLPDDAAVSAAWAKACDVHGVEGNNLSCMPRIVAKRLAESSCFWLPAVAAARQRVLGWMAHKGPQVLLSNTVGDPLSVSLVFEAKLAGIPLVVAEHGVSAGLSCYHEPARDYSEVALSDVYLTTNANATAFFDEEASLKGKSVTVGLPRQTRSIPLRPLQRLVTRRSLKARMGERVVMYLTSSIQNNSRFLPYSPEDRDVYALERTMAFDVMPEVRGVPAIKFYNTRRGLDANPLTTEFCPPGHVRLLQAGDYRFLRAGVDVVILQSPMSTMGWAFGAGVPVYYLEMAGRRLRDDVREHLQDAIFLFDVSTPGWEKELLRSLNRPDVELMSDWCSKHQARKRFLEHYVFGPKRAGWHASGAVLSLCVGKGSENISPRKI